MIRCAGCGKENVDDRQGTLCEACGLPLVDADRPEEHRPGNPSTDPESRGSESICPYCQTSILSDEPDTSCSICRAVHHRECWQENGGCSVYGCQNVPETESYQDIEIPPGYWGKEFKSCPQCGEEIRASAVRCRSCGSTFTATPMGAEAYRERESQKGRLPSVRRKVAILAIFCFIPCSAPFAALFGGLWFRSHKKDLASLPSLYTSLCYLGIGVAIVQLSIIALATGWYALVY